MLDSPRYLVAFIVQVVQVFFFARIRRTTASNLLGGAAAELPEAFKFMPARHVPLDFESNVPEPCTQHWRPQAQHPIQGRIPAPTPYSPRYHQSQNFIANSRGHQTQCSRYFNELPSPSSFARSFLTGFTSSFSYDTGHETSARQQRELTRWAHAP